MSHLHQRVDKNCLNCGTEVAGRYCQNCGQENSEPKETFWQLIVHFFNDITHFDGKFFKTLKLLILRPGFLTSEYVAGKRASYLNPIRMYLFISFLVFLVVFSLPRPASAPVRVSTQDSLQQITDSEVSAQERSRADSAAKQTIARADEIRFTTKKGFVTSRDTNIEAYLERQQHLPESERDHFIRRHFVKKVILVNEYARKHPHTFGPEILSRFRHSLPQMFFVSIPFFAFLLYLLYIRRRRAFYYVSHGIFSIHFYCAAYMFFLGFSLIGWVVGRPLLFQGFAAIVSFFYLYMAMRRFYKQSRAKTVLKYLVLTFVMVFFLTILSGVFLINSLFEVPSGH